MHRVSLCNERQSIAEKRKKCFDIEDLVLDDKEKMFIADKLVYVFKDDEEEGYEHEFELNEMMGLNLYTLWKLCLHGNMYDPVSTLKVGDCNGNIDETVSVASQRPRGRKGSRLKPRLMLHSYDSLHINGVGIIRFTPANAFALKSWTFNCCFTDEASRSHSGVAESPLCFDAEASNAPRSARSRSGRANELFSPNVNGGDDGH